MGLTSFDLPIKGERHMIKMNLFVVILMVAISYARAAKSIYVKTTGLSTSPYFEFYKSDDCTSGEYTTLKLFVGTEYEFIRCDTSANHPMKLAKSLTGATPTNTLGTGRAFESEKLTYTPSENDVGEIKYYCTVSEHTSTMNGDIDVVDLYGKAKQRTKKMWGDTYYNTHKNKFNDFENKVTEMSNKNSTTRATKAGRALNFTDFKLDEKRVAARAKSTEAEKKDAKKDVALARREIIKGALKQLKDAGKDETFAIERTKGGFSKKFEDKMIAKGIQYVDVKKVKAKTGFNNASPDCANKADVLLSDLQADDAYEIVLEEEGDFSFKCRDSGKPLSKLTLTKKNETDLNTYKAECWDGSTWKVKNDDLHEDDSYTCDGYESYVASDSGTGTLPGCDGQAQMNATSCADCPGYMFVYLPLDDNGELVDVGGKGTCTACGPDEKTPVSAEFVGAAREFILSMSEKLEFRDKIKIHMCSDQGTEIDDQGTEIDTNITSVMATSYADGYAAGQASVTPEDGITQADVDAANATGYADGYTAGQAAGGGGQAGANCVDKNDGPALKAAYVQLGQC